jgi:filamentous hemagglutinin family protein
MMQKSELQQSLKLKRLVASFLVVLCAFSPAAVNALPNGGKIVSGKGSIEQTSQDMVIEQGSKLLITNWKGFSIGEAESVTFVQPNSNAVALNRVIGSDPSIILGKLSSNGQVFLTNPSGVVFGKTAVVDVHGLLATTLNISDKDFLNGNYKFSQDPSRSLAAVINNGVIKATRYVGLVAPAVENSGSIIVADLGSVALASGTAATLDFNGDGLISFAVTGEVAGDVFDADGRKLKDRINNSGLIRANGGQVILTAKSAGEVIGNVINHSGIIEAQTVQKKDGKIILSSGDTGTVQLSGVLDAPDTFVVAGVVAVAANELLTTNNGDIDIIANDLDLLGDVDSGTGDFAFTLKDGGDLNIRNGNNPGGGIGGNDINHITAENLILKTDGDINVKGIAAEDTDGITGFVSMESGGNINFDDAASTFTALKLSAVNDINVNTDVTTTKGDFIAVADSDNNGQGDFNVAPGATITSARDIDISAVNINADDGAFSETRNLILNGATDTTRPFIDTDSILQGSLGSFLTEFFENGSSDGC